MNDDRSQQVDAMLAAWAEHSTTLARDTKLHTRAFAAGRLDRARSAMLRRRLGGILEIATSVVTISLIGLYISHRIHAPRFIAPAAALDLFVIVAMIDVLRQTVAAARIDYSRPVAEIQRRLETLRAMRIRHLRWVLTLAVLLWTPLMIVGLDVLLGIDAYRALGAAYLLANVAVGVAVIPVALWLSRTFGERLSKRQGIRRLLRDLGGSSLAAAERYIGEIEAFERG
jgi:hypothetical protein